MASHRVSTLDEADYEAWRRLWEAYNAFYGRVGPTALTAGVIAAAWARLLDPAEPVHGLIVRVDNAPAGLAHFIFHRNMLRHENTCYLQDLFVNPDFRRRGLARALIEAVSDRCAETGVHDMYWHTQRANTTARNLYDAVAIDTDFLVYRRTF